MRRIPAAAQARLRLRAQLWPVLQTAGAAVAAWYLALLLVDDPQPAFASIAAVIAVGATYGQRPGRAVELVAGVVLGITVADLLVHAIGVGPPQVGITAMLAMLAAVVLGGGPLLVTEAAVSAILLVALAPSGAGVLTRPLEALIGGGVAIAVSSLAFPPDPRLHVARAANALLAELSATLERLAGALELGDPQRAAAGLDSARDLDGSVKALEDTLAVGHETARLSPLRRPSRVDVARYATAAPQMDRAARNVRVLARHVTRFLRASSVPAPELAESVRDLQLMVWALAGELDGPGRDSELHRHATRTLGRATAIYERDPDLALAEIVAQLRSTAVDLVRASEAGGEAPQRGFETPTEELFAALGTP